MDQQFEYRWLEFIARKIYQCDVCWKTKLIIVKFCYIPSRNKSIFEVIEDIIIFHNKIFFFGKNIRFKRNLYQYVGMKWKTQEEYEYIKKYF